MDGKDENPLERIYESSKADSTCNYYETIFNIDSTTKSQDLNKRLENPLAGFSKETLLLKGRRYAIQHSLTMEEDIRAFEIGAVLAQDPEKNIEYLNLTREELSGLSKEFINRWSQPRLLYLVIGLCSICAAVQGMGEFK